MADPNVTVDQPYSGEVLPGDGEINETLANNITIGSAPSMQQLASQYLISKVSCLFDKKIFSETI